MSKSTVADDTKAKLAAARAEKEAREAARVAKLEALELERLELEAKLEKELGPLGERFEIVDASDVGEGFIAVRLGEELLWKRFSSSPMAQADAHDFVTPCVVHPETDRFLAIVGRRPALLDRCASACASLYGLKLKAARGKF